MYTTRDNLVCRESLNRRGITTIGTYPANKKAGKHVGIYFLKVRIGGTAD
jgi:hypothetical protein